MKEWSQLTSCEIERLDRRLPVILPLGLIEAHGPHLATSVDMDTAAYFGRRIAEQTGAIFLPVFSYGFADEMAEYPGTLGLGFETMTSVVVDLSSHLCRHGFYRQIFLSGHGANKGPVEAAFYRIWESHPELRAVYWNYWTEAGFNQIAHADQGETEIAMAVGTRHLPDLAQDFKVEKPWYRIRSRHALNPMSGGINGKPSLSQSENGKKACQEIIKILSEKVKTIIEKERGS